MRLSRISILAACAAFLLVSAGCAAEPSAPSPDVAPSASAPQQPASDEGSDAEAPAGSAEVTIPAGAYAAHADFPFPVPEGWAVLDPFTEGKLGKDVSIDGSVEYPGDAKAAAGTYLDVLNAAGFDAYTYGPGELTNQASLAAEGVIGGVAYVAILNFDVHADGYQRVSITITEDD